jgi:hypothetical protein
MLLARTHLVALCLLVSCLGVHVLVLVPCSVLAIHACIWSWPVDLAYAAVPPALMLCHACMFLIPHTWVPGTQVAEVRWGVPLGAPSLPTVVVAPLVPTCQAIKLQVVPFRGPERFFMKLLVTNQPTKKGWSGP